MKKLLLILSLATAIITACDSLKPTPLSEEHKIYAGKWEAVDGSYVNIYLNGKGDLKNGGTSVNGGLTTIKGDTLKIGVFGINETYIITKPPMENADGEWVMELDNNKYVRK